MKQHHFSKKMGAKAMPKAMPKRCPQRCPKVTKLNSCPFSCQTWKKLSASIKKDYRGRRKQQRRRRQCSTEKGNSYKVLKQALKAAAPTVRPPMRESACAALAPCRPYRKSKKVVEAYSHPLLLLLRMLSAVVSCL